MVVEVGGKWCVNYAAISVKFMLYINRSHCVSQMKCNSLFHYAAVCCFYTPRSGLTACRPNFVQSRRSNKIVWNAKRKHSGKLLYSVINRHEEKNKEMMKNKSHEDRRWSKQLKKGSGSLLPP